MNYKARVVSIVMTVVLLFGIATGEFSVAVSAIDIDVGTEIQTQGMNDLTVRLAINQYFAQREAFLKGNAESIDLAVAPMVTDEARHRDILDDQSIELTSYSLSIESISCGHNQAEAVVAENAVFRVNGAEFQEEVEHIVYLFLDDFGAIRVSGDGYKENVSSFISCSYIDPEKVYEITAGGSRFCITAVAETQIGEGEDAAGATKYGIWFTGVDPYGQDCSQKEWCAMFVCWCAYHANVSSTIINVASSVPDMYVFFNSRGQYYWSKAWDSSTNFTPREGDLIFIDDCPTSPNHIGIVTGCSGGYVYYIDGNSSQNGGDVRSTRATLTYSGIVAYARPSYGSASHEYSDGWEWDSRFHWKECAHCEIATISKTAHTIIQGPSGKEMCSVCLYGHSIIMKNGEVETESTDFAG